MQDAFLAVWRTAAAFDPRAARAQTWLLTLVHRRAVDVVRARGPAPHGAAGRRAGRRLGVDATTRRPSLASNGAPCRPRSRGCRRTEREALELSYYGGLTQSELAERLGIPLGTVKSRVFAGLARLRDLLGEAAGAT